VFGRRKKDGDAVEGDQEQVFEVQESPAVARERPEGPWDVADAPEDDVNRVDLGGLRVPVPPDVEVRVDVGPDGQVVAATLQHAGSAMQVNVFAAPRSAGIWDEIREEIGAAILEGGGVADDAEGPWGAELRAQVPVEGTSELAPARFVGVDGPRWFLRALLTGPAATDPAEAAVLEAALRDVVVDRGSEAMAVRHPLPLHLPREVTEQGVPGAPPGEAPEGEAVEADAPVLPALPERGPEITERR
jgi:hypothetical protein